VIEILDADGNSPSLVAWYYYDDVDEWRLIIARSAFDALIPKHEAVASRMLVEVMANLSLSSLSVSALKLVKSSSPLPLALRTLLRTGSTGTVRAHFVNTTLNGIFMKEMIILRSA